MNKHQQQQLDELQNLSQVEQHHRHVYTMPQAQIQAGGTPPNSQMTRS